LYVLIGPALLLHKHREHWFFGVAEFPYGEHQGFPLEWYQRGERQPLIFIELRDPDLALIRTEHKDIRMPITFPVADGQIAYARQSRKSFGRAQRPILLLEEKRKLAALGFGDQ